jgi:hypothetical protein
MKVSASLKPLSRDNVRTIGSVRNILNGPIHVIRISLAENGSLKDASPVDTCRRWRGLLLQRLQRCQLRRQQREILWGRLRAPVV